MTILEQPSQKSRLEQILDKELPKEPVDLSRESDFIVLTNGLQMILADRSKSKFDRENDNDDENFLAWKRDFSVRFREVFDQMISEDSSRFMGYGTLRNIPDIIIADIERRLYS